MAASLPTNPSLERFRRDARRLQRAVRAADPPALALARRYHPDGMQVAAAGFTLTAAQLVVARWYGFASWPRLKHYLEVAAPLTRDVAKVHPEGDIERFCDLACLRYSESDDPTRWAEAAAMLAAQPDLPGRSIAAAAVAADPDAIHDHLTRDP